MTDPTVDADAFNAFEAAGWEQQVAGYEEFFGPDHDRLVEPLLDAARVGRGDRVLDVASGPGHVAAAAAETRCVGRRGRRRRGDARARPSTPSGARVPPRRRREHCRFRTARSTPWSRTSCCCTSAVPSRRPPSSRAFWPRAAGSRSRSGMFPSEPGSSACSSMRWRRRVHPAAGHPRRAADLPVLRRARVRPPARRSPTRGRAVRRSPSPIACPLGCTLAGVAGWHSPHLRAGPRSDRRAAATDTRGLRSGRAAVRGRRRARAAGVREARLRSQAVVADDYGAVFG